MASGILPLIPVDITSYCEPFVGGGGVTVPLLDRQQGALDVLLNDADARVAAWWQVMADPDPRGYAGLLYFIDKTTPTVAVFNAVQKWGLEPVDLPLVKAFAGIFLNRCAYSGILSGGPIGGQNQSSRYTVDCRWNARMLVKRHEQLRMLFDQHRVTATNTDFRESIKTSPDAFVYADPPYRAKGGKIYPSPFTGQDHEDLATLLLTRSHWLLSYDDHPWVRERYAGCLIEPVWTYYTVTSKRAQKIVGKELLIRPG